MATLKVGSKLISVQLLNDDIYVVRLLFSLVIYSMVKHVKYDSGIDSEGLIPPDNVAWRAGTTQRVIIELGRQAT